MKKTKDILKSNKGITLMALVITIIVIVILVGITISAVIGDHGIITETKQAKDDYLAGEAAEQSTLDSAVSEIRRAREEAGMPSSGSGSYSGGSSSSGSGNSGSGNNNSGSGNSGSGTNSGSGSGSSSGNNGYGNYSGGNYSPVCTQGNPVTFAQATDTAMFSKTTKSAYTDTTIQNNNVVTIPAGYRMTTEASTIDEGIVIEDSNGNQWVWIPVDNASILYDTLQSEVELGGENNSGVGTIYKSKSEILNDITRGTIGDTTNYREPDLIVTYDKQDNAQTLLLQAGFSNLNATENSPSKTAIRCLAEDVAYRYYDMIQSVTYYGGFYIGRFELSGTVASPTIVKGQTVLVQSNWYQLFNACSKFTTSTAVSRMMYGCQWDAICKFISERGSGTRVNLSDSRAYGCYSNWGTLCATGNAESWRTHNIYDIAGNAFEWTQEALDSNKRIGRGGSAFHAGDTSNVTSRISIEPNSSSSWMSSRPMMYVL